MPSRCFTVDLKFSTTTSAFSASFMKMARPSLLFRFSESDLLLRWRFWKSGPSRRLPVASVCSPGASILITSAPQSASWRTAVGPARWAVRSSTMKPFKGSEVIGVSALRRENCWHHASVGTDTFATYLHPPSSMDAPSAADLPEAVDLERAADWRIRKLGENPNDTESAGAAKLLQK